MSAQGSSQDILYECIEAFYKLKENSLLV